jgi:DnaJ family protein C protein 28
MTDKWERGIDRQIEEAQREGKFDNLPGKGKPLKLNDNPFQDPAVDAAYSLLKDNDFTLPWIAEGKEIDEALSNARTALARSWALHQSEGSAGNMTWAKSEWARAENAFRDQIAALNKKILNYNVAIPSSRFEKVKISPDREIEKIQQQNG